MSKEAQQGFIYIRRHQSYDAHNACKLGRANNIPERDMQYATGEIERGYFEMVFELPIEKVAFIERLLQYEFRDYHIKYDAGTEFYNLNVLDLIEPYLISMGFEYKRLTKQEISDLVRCNRVRKTFKKINIQSFISALKTDHCKTTDTVNVTYQWNEREYQRCIIEYAKKAIDAEHKIYIELPTGGGKSCIVYNILKYLDSDFIIIVSPRKIVNSQNIDKKYLQILDSDHILFNYSYDKHFAKFLQKTGKKIVVCCTQSIDKLQENIIKYKIKNISIWFDEAHWAVEEKNANTCFWISDCQHIKNRIFTSASPNKTKVKENREIFGELYEPVRVKELIDMHWLAPIKPFVYSENIDSVDSIKYLLTDFRDKNCKYGFCFHNKQDNAYNLFYKHYAKYMNKECNSRPFLLIGKYSIKNKIKLDYDYKDIKKFEEMPYSIGYVVDMYSIGYDFTKLDFIYISDPKFSTKDIKQSIGRGIRSDGLGLHGRNKDKELVVSLPVYVDDNGINKYETIIDVLKYLLYDVEIPLDQIEFENRYECSKNTAHGKGEYSANEYDGINDVRSTLLDLLQIENARISRSITFNEVKKIIAGYGGVSSKTDYFVLCDKDHRLSKEPDVLFKGQFTNWIEYLNIPRKYYDLETCKQKIDEYNIQMNTIGNNSLDLSKIKDELCVLDPMFPPNDLWVEYYGVKDLRDIINTRNRKKIRLSI
jgi:superfamily II DNA or RNA helicase